MKIGIVDSKKAYLPEIDAYIDYFNSIGYNALRITENELLELNDLDLIWRFMGTDYRNSKVSTIHEYNSLSIGKIGQLKDKVKKHFNSKPAGRVFLNDYIKTKYSFNDNIPSIIRDMGIAKQFFVQQHVNKEYDFVYIGSMDTSRNLDEMLINFSKPNVNKNILMIGTPNDIMYSTFKGYKNIIFTGAVPYHEVPLLGSKAEYGINYIPNIYPYNMQTSTKLLEYCAMGLKIVTTNYEWVKKFQTITKASFYYMNNSNSFLNFSDIEEFNFLTPDVTDYEWSNILEKSNLKEFVGNVF